MFGLASIVELIVHVGAIIVAVFILAYIVHSWGRARWYPFALLAVVVGIYLYWLGTKDAWKDELAQSYIGTYTLTKYHKLKGCDLEIFPDHTYRVMSEHHEIERGTWFYFDNGDLFELELSNGGTLGKGEYEYTDHVQVN